MSTHVLTVDFGEQEWNALDVLVVSLGFSLQDWEDYCNEHADRTCPVTRMDLWVEVAHMEDWLGRRP